GALTSGGSPYQLVSGVKTSIAGGGTTQVVFTFAPASPGTLTGTLAFAATSGTQAQNYTFSLTGIGLQPNFITSYILQPAGNQVAVGNGGTLTFTPTNLNATTTATFVI